MTATENKVVQLNRDIGYYLLNFLDGTDACNFLEVVNKTNQFWSIATISDQIFRKLMKEIVRARQRILLPEETFKNYLYDCEVIDDKLVLLENCDSSFIQPCQRLFVHSCFNIEGFGKLCKAYQTLMFQCYSRLLPFNTNLYCSDFGLIDYELYRTTISLERDLNNHEPKLFKSKGSKINWKRRTLIDSDRFQLYLRDVDRL